MKAIFFYKCLHFLRLHGGHLVQHSCGLTQRLPHEKFKEGLMFILLCSLRCNRSFLPQNIPTIAKLAQENYPWQEHQYLVILPLWFSKPQLQSTTTTYRSNQWINEHHALIHMEHNLHQIESQYQEVPHPKLWSSCNNITHPELGMTH